MRLWNIFWRALIALIALGAAAALAAVEQNLLTASPMATFLLAVIPPIVVAVEASRSAWEAYRQPIKERDRRHILVLLRGAILSIGDVTGVQDREVGANVYRVVRRWYWPWRQHLSLVAHERFSASPQPSSVRWTANKGVIGEAWSAKRTVSADLTAEDQALKSVTDEASFKALSGALKQGFSFSEFNSIRGKYAEALACPIFDGANQAVIGMLSVDIPSTVTAPAPGALLTGATVHEVVEGTARILSLPLERA